MDSIGSLIDKLSVVNIKIFMLEDVKRDPKATDQQIADATRKTNTLNVHRNELIKEIDDKLGENNHNVKIYGR